MSDKSDLKFLQGVMWGIRRALDYEHAAPEMLPGLVAKLREQRDRAVKAATLPAPGSVESVKLAIRVLTGHEAVHREGEWDVDRRALTHTDYALWESANEILRWLDERLPDGDAGVGDG